VVGKLFPELKSKSLAGNFVTLPEAVRGKVALICVAFMRSAQSMIDSWTRPFEQEFGKESRFVIYEVPMIGSGWKLFSLVIDSGMRGGIPVEKHDNILTFYGDYSGYQKALGMENTKFAYIFLLDQEGIIHWEGQGYSSSETEKELLNAAMTLKSTASKQEDLK
jgi:hypothetical protein